MRTAGATILRTGRIPGSGRPQVRTECAATPCEPLPTADAAGAWRRSGRQRQQVGAGAGTRSPCPSRRCPCRRRVQAPAREHAPIGPWSAGTPIRSRKEAAGAKTPCWMASCTRGRGTGGHDHPVPARRAGRARAAYRPGRGDGCGPRRSGARAPHRRGQAVVGGRGPAGRQGRPRPRRTTGATAGRDAGCGRLRPRDDRSAA
jgi:hypothetical protein